MIDRKKYLSSVRRLVVKVGSNLIIGTDEPGGRNWLLHFVREVAQLRKQGLEVDLVSSGAIGAGMRLLGLKKRPQLVPLQQACAAVGQNRLMQLYERLFHRHGILVGQVLITTEDLSNRKRYFNLRHTLHTLLEMGVIPILNENDSIAVDEIKVGDNDTLAAHVTNFVEADLLLILTDIDGLFDDNPRINPHAGQIYEVEKITPHVKKYCRGKGIEASVGGMQTKITAAEIVTHSGEMMLIANGRKERISELLAGKRAGTLFLPSSQTLSSRERWIAFSQKEKGSLVLDAGGAAAVREKKRSLLAVGVKGVKGVFEKGDIVALESLDNRKIGRGITNYGSSEIDRIKGHKSSELAGILGRKDYEEVIHRDNLVILE